MQMSKELFFAIYIIAWVQGRNRADEEFAPMLLNCEQLWVKYRRAMGWDI